MENIFQTYSRVELKVIARLGGEEVIVASKGGVRFEVVVSCMIISALTLAVSCSLDRKTEGLRHLPFSPSSSASTLPGVAVLEVASQPIESLVVPTRSPSWSDRSEMKLQKPVYFDTHQANTRNGKQVCQIISHVENVLLGIYQLVV